MGRSYLAGVMVLPEDVDDHIQQQLDLRVFLARLAFETRESTEAPTSQEAAGRQVMVYMRQALAPSSSGGCQCSA